MADKKTEKFNNLQEEFNKIQDENKHLDIGMHLATLGDLPDLGEIQIYNYDCFAKGTSLPSQTCPVRPRSSVPRTCCCSPTTSWRRSATPGQTETTTHPDSESTWTSISTLR